MNDEDTPPLPGVSFIATPGHSQGHMSLELSADCETLLVTGDAWISRPDQMQNLEWEFAPEMDREAAYESSIMLLERAPRKRDRVLKYHEQYPGHRFVERSVPRSIGHRIPISLSVRIYVPSFVGLREIQMHVDFKRGIFFVSLGLFVGNDNGGEVRAC